MNAVVVELDVDEGDAELAADRLWSLGATAVEERAGERAGRRVLAAGIPAERVGAVVGGLDPRWRARLLEVDDASWADTWRAYASPVRAGERLLVVPAWLDAPEPAAGTVLIRLDPGRAFGSGTHATTRLALAALERLAAGARSRTGAAAAASSVLDVGSGSGVLAVAAALLGASTVVAVDIEPEAVRATEENAARNGVAQVVDAGLGDVHAATGSAGATFDVVVVNIGATAIVDAAADLAARLAPGGHLVLSGFLAPASARVRAAFAHLDLVDEAADGEWCALTLRTRAQ